MYKRQIQNTPDVSFIDNKTIDDVRGDMVADFEAFMLQATGSKVSLGRASVHRMILYSAAAQIYQAMQYVDRAGKQSLLKYSYSEFLDNLAPVSYTHLDVYKRQQPWRAWWYPWSSYRRP